MNEHDWLAERFEENRPHLRAVAYRVLGSVSEADDAVQETWLRLSRSGTGGVENLGGWLTTIVARVSLPGHDPAPSSGLTSTSLITSPQTRILRERAGLRGGTRLGPFGPRP